MNTIGALGELVLPALPPGFLGAGSPDGRPSTADAAAAALLISQAPQATDAQAQFFSDFTDATSLGHRKMITRYAIGGAAGLVVGGVIGLLLGGRKKR